MKVVFYISANTFLPIFQVIKKEKHSHTHIHIYIYVYIYIYIYIYTLTHTNTYTVTSYLVVLGMSELKVVLNREIHPLDPQPHRHSILVPRVCAPRVTRCRLGKYWSRDFFRKRLAGCWLESRHAQLVSRQFQSDPGPV